MKKIKRRHQIMLLILIISFLDSLLIKNISNGNPILGKTHINQTSDASILSELIYFPLASDCSNIEICYYEDSWKNVRTFGGNRKHEGTDLMTVKNERGIYPVVSMTDGMIEQIGWLKLGGWRIGIRSASGIYYYYAHMESYAPELVEGMQIQAGEFLGFVGDSGYGPEGTTGQFAVHLHIGIYLPGKKADKPVNPYPYLKKLENKKIRAKFLD